jgi:cytochrome c
VGGSQKGLTPLQVVASSGNVEMVKLLLSKKAPVNAKGAGSFASMTALHWAARGDYVEIGKLLLKAGADVRAKTSDGRTPLAIATIQKSEAMIKLLKQHGAKE